MKNTIIVNLFASPGSGKSTTAAGIFSNLKLNGCDCELVTEYAKDLVWEDRMGTIINQLYVSGKQSHRISRLIGKVDVVITDSPILLSSYYNKLNNRFTPEFFDKIIKEEFDRYNNLNYFITLSEQGYNKNGRLQSYEESKVISEELLNMLHQFNIDYSIITKSVDTISTLTTDILNYIKSGGFLK